MKDGFARKKKGFAPPDTEKKEEGKLPERILARDEALAMDRRWMVLGSVLSEWPGQKSKWLERQANTELSGERNADGGAGSEEIAECTRRDA